MFAEERPALQPLPVEPFRYYRFGVRTVHLDGCVEVEAAYYSTPPGWIGQRVQVQWTDLHVRAARARRPASCCASMCARRAAGTASHDADRPARTPASTLALLARAPPRRAASPHGLHLHPRPRGRRRRAPHPRRARAGQAVRRRPPPTTPPRRRSTSRSPPIASSAAISNGGRRRRSRSRKSTRSSASSRSIAISSIAQTGDPT